jgi:hypothetical protein
MMALVPVQDSYGRPSTISADTQYDQNYLDAMQPQELDALLKTISDNIERFEHQIKESEVLTERIKRAISKNIDYSQFTRFFESKKYGFLVGEAIFEYMKDPKKATEQEFQAYKRELIQAITDSKLCNNEEIDRMKTRIFDDKNEDVRKKLLAVNQARDQKHHEEHTFEKYQNMKAQQAEIEKHAAAQYNEEDDTFKKDWFSAKTPEQKKEIMKNRAIEGGAMSDDSFEQAYREITKAGVVNMNDDNQGLLRVTEGGTLNLYPKKNGKNYNSIQNNRLFKLIENIAKDLGFTV